MLYFAFPILFNSTALVLNTALASSNSETLTYVNFWPAAL